jgi:hypothetical protein
VPAVLFRRVGPSQYPAGPLDRETQRVEQLTHMTGMVRNPEFFLDHMGDDGRGPDPAIQAIGHWTTLEDVGQTHALCFR